MKKVNFIDIIRDKVLYKFLGMNSDLLLNNDLKFDIVIDNGIESKLLVSQLYELSLHLDKVIISKLNLEDTEFFIDLSDRRRVVLSQITQEKLLSWLNQNEFYFDLESKDIRDGFVSILLSNQTRIYYDLEKGCVYSVICDENF